MIYLLQDSDELSIDWVIESKSLSSNKFKRLLEKAREKSYTGDLCLMDYLFDSLPKDARVVSVSEYRVFLY